MADDLKRAMKLREDFLTGIYEASGGSTSAAVQMGEVGRKLGLDEVEIGRTVEWLCDRGLAAWFAFGGMITITAEGVDAAESAFAKSTSTHRSRQGGSADFAYDLFISHASEDKDEFVRPLVQELETRGLRVWFDEAELEVGDSLTERIDEGLRRSRFGAVVLSRAFFGKNWPRAELNSLASREMSTGERVVLPVWFDVEADDVREYSPLLADRFALRASDGLAAVAEKLRDRVGHTLPDSKSASDPAEPWEAIDTPVMNSRRTSELRSRSAPASGKVSLSAPDGRIDHVLWRDKQARIAAVRGWALDPLEPEASVQITIALDGKALLTSLADRKREDVAREFDLRSNHGFLVEAHIPHSGRLSLRVNNARGSTEVHSRDVP